MQPRIKKHVANLDELIKNWKTHPTEIAVTGRRQAMPI
jgi:riboflavin synthase